MTRGWSASDWGSVHPVVMVVILLLWGVVIAGIVLAVRWLARKGDLK